MWTKSIIVDRTVRRIAKVSRNESNFAYAFSGFTESGEEQWCSKAEHVKLYDKVDDAVNDARKLREKLPVDVMTYSIIPENQQVTITTVKF